MWYKFIGFIGRFMFIGSFYGLYIGKVKKNGWYIFSNKFFCNVLYEFMFFIGVGFMV